MTASDVVRPSLARPDAAPLDDPLYYLRNVDTVVHWVCQHHADLLSPGEKAQLSEYHALPIPGRALLARMLLRKGEFFRSDTLCYSEIGDISKPLDSLVRAGMVNANPACDASTLHRLCRVAELRALLKERGVIGVETLKKPDLLVYLETEQSAAVPLAQWWPQAPFVLVALSCQSLFDRVRMMFFGNAYQDWSEFVLTELGNRRYEKVVFDPSSRAFQSRDEVDAALAIAHSQQHLQEHGDVMAAFAMLPPPLANDWLAHRRERVLFHLAQQAERAGNTALALTLYRDNRMEEALIRRLRLLEKSASTEQLWKELEAVDHCQLRPLSRLHLRRIEQRARRKLKRPDTVLAPSSVPVVQESLCLSDSAARKLRVEHAVVEHLQNTSGVQAYHVENALFPGLFALLCWEQIFTPLPGAFFHPFQAGPADLFRPDFVERRQSALAEQLASLETGDYKDRIWQTWKAKQGLACRLVSWSTLTEALLGKALALIPASNLRLIFQHLIADLRHHRAGMPDLVVFNEKESSYRLVEVKGPGDRLQDHQTLWLQTLTKMGVRVSVLNVSYDSP